MFLCPGPEEYPCSQKAPLPARVCVYIVLCNTSHTVAGYTIPTTRATLGTESLDNSHRDTIRAMADIHQQSVNSGNDILLHFPESSRLGVNPYCRKFDTKEAEFEAPKVDVPASIQVGLTRTFSAPPYTRFSRSNRPSDGCRNNNVEGVDNQCRQGIEESGKYPGTDDGEHLLCLRPASPLASLAPTFDGKTEDCRMFRSGLPSRGERDGLANERCYRPHPVALPPYIRGEARSSDGHESSLLELSSGEYDPRSGPGDQDMGSRIRSGTVSKKEPFTAIDLLGLQRWGNNGSDKAMEELLREDFGVDGLGRGGFWCDPVSRGILCADANNTYWELRSTEDFIRCLGRDLPPALLALKGHALAHGPWRYMGVPYDETADEQDPDAFWDDGDSVATADSSASFYLG